MYAYALCCCITVSLHVYCIMLYNIISQHTILYYIYIYIYMYTYMYAYIYIYIERERER